VVNQALNITRESRIRLLAAAFDVVRLCDQPLCYSKLKQQHKGGSRKPIYLYRQIDMNKVMASLVVLGFVLTLPIDRINLSRIGTAALEHLFGVTRLGTGGSNSAERIIRLLARAFVVKKIAEGHGIDLGGRTKMNLAGAVDDLTKDDLRSIPNLDMPDPISRTFGAELFCSFIQNPWGGGLVWGLLCTHAQQRFRNCRR
jgi:hypothetical protein